MGLWRNGSACDSSSQGYPFKSGQPHSFLVFFCPLTSSYLPTHLNEDLQKQTASNWPLTFLFAKSTKSPNTPFLRRVRHPLERDFPYASVHSTTMYAYVESILLLATLDIIYDLSF